MESFIYQIYEHSDLVDIKIIFHSSKYNVSDPKFMELKQKINGLMFSTKDNFESYILLFICALCSCFILLRYKELKKYSVFYNHLHIYIYKSSYKYINIT